MLIAGCWEWLNLISDFQIMLIVFLLDNNPHGVRI